MWISLSFFLRRTSKSRSGLCYFCLGEPNGGQTSLDWREPLRILLSYLVLLSFFPAERAKETFAEGAGENDCRHFLWYLREWKTKVMFWGQAKMNLVNKGALLLPLRYSLEIKIKGWMVWSSWDSKKRYQVYIWGGFKRWLFHYG